MAGRLIDISRRISPRSMVYGNGPPMRMAPMCSIEGGGPFNITQLDWSTHFLTHVDPPRHAIAGGASLDEIPLSRFMGASIVVEVAGDAIEPEDVPSDAAGLNVLFKTRNSAMPTEGPFDENFVYLSGPAAEKLAAQKVNLVGIDHLNIDRFGDFSFPSHYALLGNDILILEGLDLSQASPGRYELMALPLRIVQGDGSPVRAVLISKS
jgi:arylformamidase